MQLLIILLTLVDHRKPDVDVRGIKRMEIFEQLKEGDLLLLQPIS